MHLKHMLHVAFTCATDTNPLTLTANQHPADLINDECSFPFFEVQNMISFCQGRSRYMTAQICVSIAACILDPPCLFVINLKETVQFGFEYVSGEHYCPSKHEGNGRATYSWKKLKEIANGGETTPGRSWKKEKHSVNCLGKQFCCFFVRFKW